MNIKKFIKWRLKWRFKLLKIKSFSKFIFHENKINIIYVLQTKTNNNFSLKYLKYINSLQFIFPKFENYNTYHD